MERNHLFIKIQGFDGIPDGPNFGMGDADKPLGGHFYLFAIGKLSSKERLSKPFSISSSRLNDNTLH